MLQSKLELENQERNYKLEHVEINAKTVEYYKELNRQKAEIIPQKRAIEEEEERIIRLSLGVACSFSNLTVGS